MKVSINWLKKYIDLSDVKVDQIANTLTDLGLEVESIEQVTGVDTKVVVGEVLEAQGHPNADSLKVCRVNVGAEEPLQIVCGAPNARAGIKVAVAQVGAVLPGDFKIKPSKIRGEKSSGMLCSGKELTVSEEDEGIMELDSSLALGTTISSVFPIGDTVLEIGLTPNRSDCNGYIGIARDLSAKLGRKLQAPELMPVQEYHGNVSCNDSVTIRVNNPEDCPRFVAIYATHVSVVPSPLWMQKQLEAAGMRPINLIVDITNYVMLEQNQPIHAYDERVVAGNTLEVRQATKGEKLVTLDGVERTLEPGDLLICDQEKPVGLAGIMGGQNSEVKEDTSSIIVEVANFPASQIRKTSKRVGIHSEASHRFERGLDVNNLEIVARRVTDLLMQCSKELGIELPQVSKDIIDSHPDEFPKNRIALRLDRTKKLLGLPTLTLKKCIDLLERLHFVVIDHTDKRILIEAPSYRIDIEREVDLIEEIARLHGFDKIPYTLPTMSLRPNMENGLISFEARLRNIFAGMGLSETMTYPFVSKAQCEDIGLKQGHPLGCSLKLKNPLSEEFCYLQNSQIPALLKALQNARAKGTKAAKVFQIGRGFSTLKVENSSLSLESKTQLKILDEQCSHFTLKAREETNRPIEKVFATIAFDNPSEIKSWNCPEQKPDFFSVKSVLETVLGSLGVSKLNYLRPNGDDFAFLHPGKSAIACVASGEAVAWMGVLHPAACLKAGISMTDAPVFLEVSVETLFKQVQEGLNVDSTIRKFPAASRDISFAIAESTSHEQIMDTVLNTNKTKHFKTASCFDVYEGEHMEKGLKSMAYTLVFRSDKKTLTDKEVDKEVRLIMDNLQATLNASQR